MADVKIAPSVLAADFLELGEQIRAIEQGGADRVHIDVMDGRFVPNISFGLPVVAALRRVTRLPLETHLMIDQPERYLADFARAGSDSLLVHVEDAPHLHRTVQAVKQLQKKVGVVLNPATPASALEEILPELDLVLVMTVNPGFGGQHLIESTLTKLATVRALIAARNPACELEVDGGIDAQTAPRAVAAGANVLVAGTSVFGHPDGPAAGVRALLQTVR